MANVPAGTAGPSQGPNIAGPSGPPGAPGAPGAPGIPGGGGYGGPMPSGPVCPLCLLQSTIPDLDSVPQTLFQMPPVFNDMIGLLRVRTGFRLLNELETNACHRIRTR